jgi:GntR family transcriptional regulator
MTNKKLNLQIDFRSGLPIYTQIVNQIQSQVVAGVLAPGDQLPTVRGLAEELRVNFNTVARAYRLLDEARIISTQQGRGTYITEIPPPRVTEKLRRESLEALTHRFISEAMRLDFTKVEINQMVDDQLKAWKDFVELGRNETDESERA